MSEGKSERTPAHDAGQDLASQLLHTTSPSESGTPRATTSVSQWVSDLQHSSDPRRLGKAGSRLAQLLSWEPHFASYASVGEIAARADLHPSSVTRAAQNLGFDGWPSLREALREIYLRSAEQAPSTLSQNGASDDISVVLAHIQHLREPEAADSVREIASAITESRRTVVLGSGLAAAPGTVLTHLGTLAGVDIRLAIQAPTTQLALIAGLGAGDCVVGINIWRMTRALYESLRAAKEQGATVCLITDTPGSRLNDQVDHLLYVPSHTPLPIPSITATTLAAELIVKQAFTTLGTSHAHRIEELWERSNLMDLHD